MPEYPAGAAVQDPNAVHRTGNETIAGTKAYQSAPTVPANSFAEDRIANLVADLAAKATDAAVVHKATANADIGVAGLTEATIAGLVADLAAKAVDAAVAHKAGAETLTGVKTFSGGLVTTDSRVDIRFTGADPTASAAANTTAINDALALAAAIGGVAYVPPIGTFNHNGTLNVPPTAGLVGEGYGSHLNYTGAGNAVSLNGGGALTEFASAVAGVRLTTSSGTVGVYLRNCAEVDIIGNYITGFSNAGIRSDPSVGEAVICVNVDHNKLLANGRGLRFTGANQHNQWAITHNRIQGSTVGPGIQADQSLTAFYIAGNDIEGNQVAEILLGWEVNGAVIEGNYFETSGSAANECILINGSMGGAGAIGGIVITGNHANQDNGAASTGRFFHCTANPASLSGIVVQGNNIGSYGGTTHPAIDGGNRTYYASTFGPNFFAGVTYQVGNVTADGAILGNDAHVLVGGLRLELPGAAANEVYFDANRNVTNDELRFVFADTFAVRARIAMLNRNAGNGNGQLSFQVGPDFNDRITLNEVGIGFFDTAPIGRPNIGGSRGGNAALASLLTGLAALGLISDSTSP